MNNYVTMLCHRIKSHRLMNNSEMDDVESLLTSNPEENHSTKKTKFNSVHYWEVETHREACYRKAHVDLNNGGI